MLDLYKTPIPPEPLRQHSLSFLGAEMQLRNAP
jgi:hypothetical protein